MTDEKKDEKKEQTPHIQINNSFFSLTDRDKRREIMCHLIRNYEIHEQLTILNQCIKDGDFTLIKGY